MNGFRFQNEVTIDRLLNVLIVIPPFAENRSQVSNSDRDTKVICKAVKRQTFGPHLSKPLIENRSLQARETLDRSPRNCFALDLHRGSPKTESIELDLLVGRLRAGHGSFIGWTCSRSCSFPPPVERTIRGNSCVALKVRPDSPGSQLFPDLSSKRSRELSETLPGRLVSLPLPPSGGAS